MHLFRKSKLTVPLSSVVCWPSLSSMTLGHADPLRGLSGLGEVAERHNSRTEGIHRSQCQEAKAKTQVSDTKIGRAQV